MQIIRLCRRLPIHPSQNHMHPKNISHSKAILVHNHRQDPQHQHMHINTPKLYSPRPTTKLPTIHSTEAIYHSPIIICNKIYSQLFILKQIISTLSRITNMFNKMGIYLSRTLMLLSLATTFRTKEPLCIPNTIPRHNIICTCLSKTCTPLQSVAVHGK